MRQFQIWPADRHIRRVQRHPHSKHNTTRRGISGGVESVQLGASHVEGGLPEHLYLPRRYMGEEEGFCCMGEDRETH